MPANSSKARPTAEEREYFGLINQAVFSNPFSQEREAIDRQLAGLCAGASPESALSHSVARIQARIDRLEREGRASVDRYAGTDRHLVENAFLYDFFHRFLDRFDRLIAEQAEAGPAPLPVAFADEAFVPFCTGGALPLQRSAAILKWAISSGAPFSSSIGVLSGAVPR